MGKSDPYIFAEYAKILPKFKYESIAFLGQTSDNEFTKLIDSNIRHFYDLSLGNWDINSDWNLERNYDLIVCTRCAYFSKDPQNFIEKCKRHLTASGHALIDWGLGDHWRFDDYKVGWIRNGHHEFAYFPENFLYSCFWQKDLENHPEVIKFWSWIKENDSFGYAKNENLTDVVIKEVPFTICYKTSAITIKCLWPKSPQLYIITMIESS